MAMMEVEGYASIQMAVVARVVEAPASHSMAATEAEAAAAAVAEAVAR